MRMAAGQINQLTKLNDTSINNEYSVVAVIKYAKGPTKAIRGYHIFMSLIDESIFFTINSKISVNLFIHNQENWNEIRPYRIIRLHRLKIQDYCGNRQGYGTPGCHFVLLDERPEASLDILYSSSARPSALTDAESQRVKELRKWVRENRDLFKKCEDVTPVCFSDVEPGQYFSNICQMLHCEFGDPVLGYLIVQVTDGTPVKRAIRRSLETGEVARRQNWKGPRDGLEPSIVEMRVHGSHSEVLRGVKPGDFLRLKSVHAFLEPAAGSDVDTMVFAFHKGSTLELEPWSSTRVLEIRSRLETPSRGGDDRREDPGNVDEGATTRGEGATTPVARARTIPPKTTPVDGARTIPPKTTLGEPSPGRKRPMKELDHFGIFSKMPSTGFDDIDFEPELPVKAVRISRTSTSVQTIEVEFSDEAGESRRDGWVQTIEKDFDPSGNFSYPSSGVEGEPSKAGCSADDVRREWDGVVIDHDSSISCDEDDVYQRDKSLGYQKGPEGQRLTLRTFHEDVEMTSLRFVKRALPGLNFRVRAKVVEYSPRPSPDSQFVRLYCSLCCTLQPLYCLNSRDKKCSWSCKEKCNSVLLLCQRCKSNNKLSALRHVFIFRFVLLGEDGRGTVRLPVYLWGDEAADMLSSVTCPRMAACVKSEMKKLQVTLDRLVGSSVECCLTSFEGDTVDGSTAKERRKKKEVFHRMFDTYVVWISD